jgi:glycosyltransferase involved in cell wall biosynthesis
LTELDLTVLIPTIPEREALFLEAVASIDNQTLAPEVWIAQVDSNRRGPAVMLNEMAQNVDTEWLFRLDDDDLLDPDHFEVLEHWLDDDADIVYTWCRIEGGGELHPEAQFQDRWQDAEGWDYLRVTNFIPCSAAIRTSLWRQLGGLNPNHPEEDWDFWIRALDAGARFRCIPAVTWTYRMNPEWEHRQSSVDGSEVCAP